jgi:hypothetical protein
MDVQNHSPFCRSSKLIYFHLIQFTCAACILILDAFTWSRVHEYWGAIYFAVIGVLPNQVLPNNQNGIILLFLYALLEYAIKQYVGEPCKHVRRHADRSWNSSHRWRTFRNLTICWILSLAIWITLSVEMSYDTMYCSRVSGGGYKSTKECNTFYAAYAFALAQWVVLTWSLGYVMHRIHRERGVEGFNGSNNIERGVMDRGVSE